MQLSVTPVTGNAKRVAVWSKKSIVALNAIGFFATNETYGHKAV